jgi:hypothetical protein
VIGAVAGAALPEPAREPEALEGSDAGDADEPDEDDSGPESVDGNDGAVVEAPLDIPPAVDAAPLDVETLPAAIEPSSPKVASREIVATETQPPVETATTPQAESSEPATAATEPSDPPDPHQPPDPFGD